MRAVIGLIKYWN